MNIEQARFNMVEQQIRPWDVLDPKVLNLLHEVKREAFVPEAYRALAFADLEIPIGAGEGQCMLPPRVEAKFLQEVAVKPEDRVLEIGTGTGYMAALLAARAEHVVSIEKCPELAEMARANLRAAGVANVTVEVGDGSRGLPARGPYDVIVVSGSLPAVPQALLGQLRIGGRLAVIVGKSPVMEAQLVTCTAEGRYNTVNLFETVVAPLEGAAATQEFAF